MTLKTQTRSQKAWRGGVAPRGPGAHLADEQTEVTRCAGELRQAHFGPGIGAGFAVGGPRRAKEAALRWGTFHKGAAAAAALREGR